MNPAHRPDLRRAELARVHCLKRDLGLTEEQYRAILWTICRVESSAHCADYQRRQLIAHLAAIPQPGQPRNLAQSPQLRKIGALLHAARRPWAYASAMALRMFHKERLEFCSVPELSGIISALVYDARRHPQVSPPPEPALSAVEGGGAAGVSPPGEG